MYSRGRFFVRWCTHSLTNTDCSIRLRLSSLIAGFSAAGFPRVGLMGCAGMYMGIRMYVCVCVCMCVLFWLLLPALPSDTPATINTSHHPNSFHHRLANLPSTPGVYGRVRCKCGLDGIAGAAGLETEGLGLRGL